MKTFLIYLFICFYFAIIGFSNPTGLIDDLALGINRSKIPKELKVSRHEKSNKPYLELIDSGNIIFQINSSGNLEWMGVLNDKRTTYMGNLSPDGNQYNLGSPTEPWNSLYLNELNLPITNKDSIPVSSNLVNNTLEQLLVVKLDQNSSHIYLKLKQAGVQPIIQPIQQNYFNATQLIPILVKKIQDMSKDITKLAGKVTSLQQESVKINQASMSALESISFLTSMTEKLELKLTSEKKETLEKVEALEKQLRDLSENYKRILLEFSNIKSIESQTIPKPLPENSP